MATDQLGRGDRLAEGLFTAELRALLDDPRQSRGLFRELLIIVYRILFLLFAEQRRMLPADGRYAETYSITNACGAHLGFFRR